jgi:hypothetical protein
MANGILGSADLAATTYTPIYLVPEDTFSVVTVSICNKNATSITVRLAVAKTDPTGATLPAADDYLEHETEILPNGVLERTGIVIDESRQVYARSSAANTVVMVYGIETATA